MWLILLILPPVLLASVSFLCIHCCCCSVAQLCPTLCNPMDCNPHYCCPNSHPHGLMVRIFFLLISSHNAILHTTARVIFLNCRSKSLFCFKNLNGFPLLIKFNLLRKELFRRWFQPHVQCHILDQTIHPWESNLMPPSLSPFLNGMPRVEWEV